MDFGKILFFIKQKHSGQFRKHDAIPYYEHPIAVAKILKDKGFDETYQITALLHDTLEDTNATYEEILALSTEEIADAVVLLTKQKGYIQQEYIANIAKNELAKIIKLADRLHNLQDSIYTTIEFRKKYILETQEWYVPLSKGTIFEEDISIALQAVINSL